LIDVNGPPATLKVTVIVYLINAVINQSINQSIKVKFKRDCSVRHVHRHSSQHTQVDDATHWCYCPWNIATRWLSLSSVLQPCEIFFSDRLVAEGHHKQHNPLD